MCLQEKGSGIFICVIIHLLGFISLMPFLFIITDVEETPEHPKSQLILKREVHEGGIQDREEKQVPDSDIIDGILSVLRRKLLSYPLDASEGKEGEEASRHRVRHFGRKPHHRRYDETQPLSHEAVPPQEDDSQASAGHQSNATTHANNTTHTSANSFSNTNNSISNTSEAGGESAPRGEDDFPRSNKAGEQSTSTCLLCRSTHDHTGWMAWTVYSTKKQPAPRDYFQEFFFFFFAYALLCLFTIFYEVL